MGWAVFIPILDHEKPQRCSLETLRWHGKVCYIRQLPRWVSTFKKEEIKSFRSKNEDVLSTWHPEKYCPLIHDTALVSFPAGWAEPVFMAPYGT